MKGNNKSALLWRGIFLALFTAAVTIVSTLHVKLGGGTSPSIHALCPYGGLESLYQFFSSGTFISKIFSGTLILFFVSVVLAVLFRRSFCGLLCPFGAIQQFISFIGRKLKLKRIVVPAKLDRILRYTKYLVLVVTVYFAWKTAGLWVAPYDPWSAYSHLSEGLQSVWQESAVGLIILALVLIGSLFIERIFCKYLCPMGAFYSLTGKLSPFRVQRNENECINCGKCSKVCPMNIDVQHAKTVTSGECINCQSCVLNCPKSDALYSKFAKKKLSPWPIFVFVFAVFFGILIIFASLKSLNLMPEAAKPASISFSEVKGYMTIEDASKATGLSLEDFYKKFEIKPSVPKETKMKEISTIDESYSFDDIKEKLE